MSNYGNLNKLENETKNIFILFRKNKNCMENFSSLFPKKFFIAIQQLYLDPVYYCVYAKNKKAGFHGDFIKLDGVKNFIKTVLADCRKKKLGEQIADEILSIEDLKNIEYKYPDLFAVNDYRRNE